MNEYLEKTIQSKKITVELLLPVLRHLWPEITDIEYKFDNWEETIQIGYLKINSHDMRMSREKFKICVTADSNEAMVNDILSGCRRKLS